MEFCEKLQALRKNKGLTQEELAEALYVSRTAISKWESGKGYPSIDSLKAVSSFFGVSIDHLLSAEKLIFIAEKENESKIKHMCSVLYSLADLSSLLMIVLPLYSKTADQIIYSVNLLNYAQSSQLNRVLCWIFIICLVLTGVFRMYFLLVQNAERAYQMNLISIVVNILFVFFLALIRQPYALILAFIQLIFKTWILIQSSR